MKNIAGRLLVSFALVFFASSVWAAELYLTTFLQTSPLKGLDVELDGRPLGTTGERGDVTAELDAGSHAVRLLKNAVPLTQYSFSVGEDESAELSITFSDFETPPEISIAKYGAGAQDGASGVLSGVVSDAAGNPVAGARVSIPQTGAEVVTDASGAYSVELPRGTYTLSVAQPGYRTATSENVRVVANIGVVADVTLRRGDEIPGGPAAPALEDVVVIGVYKPSERTVDKERFAVTITDAIDVDELLRFGDTDVAASLRRIVGVSVTGGRYAVVRGLDGRYIAATLNGSLMPSTDPFRRDVQLDLFPNDILGGIEIQKSFSADMPGDTTGGIVKIKTRELPDEYVNTLSGSIGYVTGVTGEDLATYEGSDSDDYGIDDGLRSLPAAVYAATDGGRSFTVCQFEGQGGCVALAQAAALASQLPNIYNPGTESAGPDFGLSYSLGDLFEVDGGNFGAYGSVSFDKEAKSRQGAFIDIPNVRRADYARDEIETALNGYLVAGYQGEGWELLGKTIVLRTTEDTTRIEEGVDLEADQKFREVLLEWVERQFFGQQFEGNWYVFDDHRLDWRAGISQTTRESPDRRSYEYQAGLDENGDFGPRLLIVPTVKRSYADLTEDGVDFGIDYMLPIAFSTSVVTDFQFGALYNNRDRESELVRLSFAGGNNVDRSADLESLLTPENFSSGEFRLVADTTATDAYNAEQETVAYYLNTTTNIGEALTLVAGVRADDFRQTIDFPNSTTSRVDIDSNEVLPAVGAVYRFNGLQLRAGYSATVSRPNITENAPTRFFDERGREYIGCTAAGAPACVPSTIDNYDLRAEYYFNDDRDSISVAFFHKEISEPIERAISQGSGSSTSALTFRNNDSATVSGVELDASWSALELVDHALNVGVNVAFIESEIELGALGRQLEAESNRELQGQSPFLANFQLSYDHFPWAQKITLVANYFDDRIDIVARAPQTPIFEVGRATVNLTYEKEFVNRSKVSFKVKNLLNEEIEYEQNGRIIESYEEGSKFSLGYSYRF